jgi:hypothetical protein
MLLVELMVLVIFRLERPPKWVRSESSSTLGAKQKTTSEWLEKEFVAVPARQQLSNHVKTT